MTFYLNLSKMIVDIHTHFFNPDKHFGAALLHDLQLNNVVPSSWGDIGHRHLETTKEADVSIVFGLKAAATGWNIPNDEVAAHVQKAPDRLLFFASIDPASEGFMEELEKMHQQYGAVGIKLAPLYQNVHPSDPKCYQIYHYC